MSRPASFAHDRPRASSLSKTTAGRLIGVLFPEDVEGLHRVAAHARIPYQQLIACRDANCRLDAAAQLRLAHAVLQLAPEHSRAANHLQAQARATIEFEAFGHEVRHRIYPRAYPA